MADGHDGGAADGSVDLDAWRPPTAADPVPATAAPGRRRRSSAVWLLAVALAGAGWAPR